LPTATPYTLQGFQKAYQTSVSNYTKLGIPEDQLRVMYAVDILRQKLMDAVTANTPHSQDQIWARHIVVADEATANTVRQRLLNGEDFAKVAAEVSTDTNTKSSGGDLGWFPQNTQDPQLEAVAAVAFSMKVSEISQPVKTQSGYEIIQVLAHAIVPLDAPAYETARQMAFTDWFAKERKNYNVVTYNNWQNLVPTVSGAATIIPQ
jgi:parvulin-like peptidyl-prolyl isomerase